MEKAYCSLHITTYRGLAGIGAHIDRHHMPSNADPERTSLNEELAPKAQETLPADVAQRIEEGYTQDRKLRKDARKALGVILTGSHKRMKAIEKDPALFDAWKAANYRFACEHFGKDNIVRFTLHRDERTPHIHCVFVPITADGRLAAKDFVGGKEYGAGSARLRAYQEAYGKAMAPFGLARGLPVERTQAKHISKEAYYATLQELEGKATEQTAQIHWRNVLKMGQVQAAVQRTLVAAHGSAWEMARQQKRLTRDYEGELARALENVKKNVNLVQHAASMGYHLRTAESNAQHAVMEKAGDKVLVSLQRNEQGHWVYQSTTDPEDRGTTVEFMTKRGYDLWRISKLSSAHLDKAVLKDLPLQRSLEKGKQHSRKQEMSIS